MQLYRRRWGMLYLPVVGAASLAIAAAAHWLFPLPPRSVVVAVGVPQGSYDSLAEQYRDELERRGIAMDAEASAPGTARPLQRLAAADDPAQAGFDFGLVAQRTPDSPVQALAVIGKQPVWMFTRQTNVATIAGLKNMRIAAGATGSPTRRVAEMLLAQSFLKPGDVTWSASTGMAGATELLDQRADAFITVASGDAAAVRLLSHASGVVMLGLDRADALAAREPRLSSFVLPQGAIELRGDVPARDLTMLYTGTHLLVRSTAHPALQRALLDAAMEIHAMPTFLQRQNEYPDFHTDFTLSPIAQRYEHGDRPWLESALPYWWAQLAELVLYAVVPIALVAMLALVWIPRLFSLRVNAALARYYGELNFLERDVDDAISDQPIRIKQLLGKLDQMEVEVAALDIPDRFADRWYTLRQHLVNVRERLLATRAR
ncbi:MAG TPA: hypothetical protein VL593_14635 [Ramlibacter sp.]|nr:hypothetical protein [Ramlibacter sp.]